MKSFYEKLVYVSKRDGFYYTLKRAVAFFIAHTPLSNCLSFSYTNKTRLVFAPTLLTYSIFADKQTRHDDVDLIKQYTQVGGTMLDVGGNIGSITIPVAQHVGKTGTVHIFEPSPRFFKIICRNIKLNSFADRVTAHQVALGAHPDTVYLNESVADDTMNHIADTGTAVQQDTLDSFTESLTKIDFLKIDVEGYEQEVLKGAAQTLEKTAVLFIEFIPSQLERCGGNPQAVLDTIGTYFTINTVTEGKITPFTYNPSDSHHPDLLCFRKTI